MRKVAENIALPSDQAQPATCAPAYGHEAAAAIFSIIASCRLHGIDPFVYFDEVLRVLPYWPHDCYLELAPRHWLETRARLEPGELERPLSRVTAPPLPSASSEASTPAG